MNKERCLLVISGPSGAGKDTVVRRMLEQHPEIEMSVSATTRAPREHEVDGVDYYFLKKEDFEKRLEQGDVLEHVKYCDNYYGTLKSEIEQRMEKYADFHYAAQRRRIGTPAAHARNRNRRSHSAAAASRQRRTWACG